MKKKFLIGTAGLIGLINLVIGVGSVIFSRLNGLDWLTILADGGGSGVVSTLTLFAASDRLCGRTGCVRHTI